MTAVVPDASVVLSLAFSDEEAAFAERMLAAVAAGGAVVPALFWFEIRNGLVIGERRGRLSQVQTSAFLADLEMLPIEIDSAPRETIVLEFARQYRLTVYDAAYLELAHRRYLPLVTLDDALAKAAKKAGVPPFAPNA